MSKGVRRGNVSPLRKKRPIAGGHVADERGHLHGEVQLAGDLGVGLLQLNEVLFELVVAKNGVRVVSRVIDDAAPELGRSGAHRQPRNKQAYRNFSSHETVSFLPSRDPKAWCGSCSRAGPDRPRDRPSRGGPPGSSRWA